MEPREEPTTAVFLSKYNFCVPNTYIYKNVPLNWYYIRNMYVYVYTHTYMPAMTLIEKIGHETRRDIREGLEKDKGRKKCNYIEISKIKTVKESVAFTPNRVYFLSRGRL